MQYKFYLFVIYFVAAGFLMKKAVAGQHGVCGTAGCGVLSNRRCVVSLNLNYKKINIEVMANKLFSVTHSVIICRKVILSAVKQNKNKSTTKRIRGESKDENEEIKSKRTTIV